MVGLIGSVVGSLVELPPFFPRVFLFHARPLYFLSLVSYDFL